MNINSDVSLNLNASFYFINASSGNINITVADINNDLEFYNFIRIDNTSNVVNINLGNCNLITNESNFDIHPLANFTIMSTNNLWVPINGYTKDR